MSVFLFIAVVIIAYFVVRIGAAAFELTGLDPEQANFQSVSAFTGTGFTTRESELVAAHKERRKIASILMILGSAGFVTLIATLVSTITPDNKSVAIIPVLADYLPFILVPYANLCIVLLLLLLIYRIFHSSRLSHILMSKLQQQMIDKKLIQRTRFEELLLNAEGYGIAQVEITKKNPLLNKTLSESRLRTHDILVLSIERGSEYIVNPTANARINLRDTLVCFGKLENIRELACEEEKK